MKICFLIGVFCFFATACFADEKLHSKWGEETNFDYWKPTGSLFNTATLIKSAIPNTTLFVQRVDGNISLADCVFLVKGMIKSAKDIDNIKPDDVLQMSCMSKRVEVVN